MHTIEDEKNIKEYEKYILRNGIDLSVIDAYCEASKIILCGRKDREYGLKVSTRAKELIFEYIKSITNGADFNWLETQSQKNKQSYDILDKYYDLLLYEAPYILDSYILYIEKNRPKKERFYEPRRKTLKQVADKLQELEDGKLDELFIHMPPRVGKLISDDTPVFTSKGWKKHGDLKVGDLVVGFDGRYVKVICVHPKHHTTHTVFLSNGESIDCHENHEWTVFDRRSGKYRTVETKQLIGHLKNGNRNNFMLPHKPMMDGEYKENRVKKRELTEVIMTREQAKQKLISFGVAEPTDEQISDLLNSINAETKKEKDRADGYKEKANKADELQTQLDELNSQNMTELEKATTALEAANKQIAQLEKKDTVRTQRANAMEKFGITAEQASKVVTDDGSTDYEVLGQIFADSKKTAIAEYEKQKLDDTPNPGGSTGGSGEEKTNAEKLVEKYYSGQKQNNDVLSHYVGGN